MNTKNFLVFENNLNEIVKLNKINSDYLKKLLFANIITAFEVYLQNSFIALLSEKPNLFIKLTESNKFKNNKITLKQAFDNDMKIYLTTLVKDLVYHNLSDVEPLFNEVLGVKINFNDPKYLNTRKDSSIILEHISKRHDVVHRNGYNKDGVQILFSLQDIDDVAADFKSLVSDIDKQILNKYSS